MSRLSTIAFDADDTLWHNETIFQFTQSKLAGLLAEFADPDHIDERLLAAERRNIHHYGFGVKGFVLSMIETAIEVTDHRVPAGIIQEILESGQAMLNHPVELLPGVDDVLMALKDRFRLIIITKGDLFDQERKVAQSGIDHLFDAVEVVSDKQAATYEKLFAQHGRGASQGLMVGNSLKSDIIPALDAGAFAVHVPYHVTFALEHAALPEHSSRFAAITHLAELLPLIERIEVFGESHG